MPVEPAAGFNLAYHWPNEKLISVFSGPTFSFQGYKFSHLRCGMAESLKIQSLPLDIFSHFLSLISLYMF